MLCVIWPIVDSQLCACYWGDHLLAQCSDRHSARRGHSTNIGPRSSSSTNSIYDEGSRIGQILERPEKLVGFIAMLWTVCRLTIDVGPFAQSRVTAQSHQWLSTNINSLSNQLISLNLTYLYFMFSFWRVLVLSWPLSANNALCGVLLPGGQI